MKKRSLGVFTLLFIFVLNSFAMTAVAANSMAEMQAEYEQMKALVEEKMSAATIKDENPATTGNSELSEDSKLIILVYDKLTENKMLDIAKYIAADENAEVWLYPLRGNIEKLKLEIGYVLSDYYWGRGIMPEAGKVVISYLFEEGFNRIQALHDEENPKSGRVMQKIGMEYEGTLKQYEKRSDGKFSNCKIYAIIKD